MWRKAEDLAWIQVMAAGLADHFWTFSDIARMLD